MSSERQPLLNNSDTDRQPLILPRPDLRNSPENVIVDCNDSHPDGE